MTGAKMPTDASGAVWMRRCRTCREITHHRVFADFQVCRVCGCEKRLGPLPDEHTPD